MGTDDFCPECKGILVEDIKEVWCSACGLVVMEQVYSEREMFDEDSQRIIYPTPTLLAQPIQPTKIG